MSTWPTVSFGELADFKNGLNYTQSARRSGGLPIIGVKDFQDRVWVEFDGLDELDPGDVDPGEVTIRQGDILFVRSNGNRELIGRSMFVRSTPARLTTYSGFAIRARLRDRRADPRFFAYLLRGPLIRRTLSSQGGGTNISNLNQTILASLQVPLPSRAVQVRIASILGAYDDLIEVNRRRIAVLEEMARRLFEEWFVHLRFPGHAMNTDGMTEVPLGWRLGKLGDLISLPYGKAMKATDRAPGSVPVIGSSGVVGYHSEALVPRPGIVLGRKGNVGSVVWSPVPFFPIDTVFYVESDYPSVYLLQLLRRLPFQSSDAAVPGLNRSAALKLPVTVPPWDLVKRFEEFVSPMARLVDRLSDSQDRLAASRDLLLPRLIAGDLAVTTAERELEALA